jgi:hypothetical protein
VAEVQQWVDAQAVDADKKNFSLFLLYIGKLIFIGLGLLFVRKAVLFSVEKAF